MDALKRTLCLGALVLLALALVSPWLPPAWLKPDVTSQRLSCERQVGITRDSPALYAWTKELRAFEFLTCMMEAGFRGQDALP